VFASLAASKMHESVAVQIIYNGQGSCGRRPHTTEASSEEHCRTEGLMGGWAGLVGPQCDGNEH
jgi:hypothetical protein